ncbi:MAG: MobP3 family relaxase [Oscillospiraceae bacterium]
MAKLVTKFKYLKPNSKMSVGGYARYIATREGVEFVKEDKLSPASIKQQQLIEKILKDFPDTCEMLEYDDYSKNKTASSATEFITRAIEDNAFQVMSKKTYADYIATRPRAERFGSHGLFTDDSVMVSLSKVSEELNLHEGNVWTMIVSLRREDAERLGFNNATRFRDMLRTQTETLSANLKIPMDNLKWFAAYHNESYHPHVHLIAYSVVENEGYLTKQGVQNIRASLAKDIFAQDNLGIYKKQTEYRDVLREDSKNIVADIIDSINLQGYGNAKIEELLLKLADKLSKTSGKKVYGYLKSDVKNIIDSIVDELASDIRIAKLYDLWYEQKYAVLKNYTDTIPLKIPLSKNKEFKSIKNAVINEALNINLDSIISEDENFKITISKPEPTNAVKETEKAIALPKSSAGQDNIFEKNLQKSYSHKNSNVGMGVFRLFNHLSRIIQNKLEEDKHGKIGILDRKLKSEIDEKKQAHGLRLE